MDSFDLVAVATINLNGLLKLSMEIDKENENLFLSGLTVTLVGAYLFCLIMVNVFAKNKLELAYWILNGESLLIFIVVFLYGEHISRSFGKNP